MQRVQGRNQFRFPCPLYAYISVLNLILILQFQHCFAVNQVIYWMAVFSVVIHRILLQFISIFFKQLLVCIDPVRVVCGACARLVSGGLATAGAGSLTPIILQTNLPKIITNFSYFWLSGYSAWPIVMF